MFCSAACVRDRARFLDFRSQSKLPAVVFITNILCIFLYSFCPYLRRLVPLMDEGVWEGLWV